MGKDGKINIPSSTGEGGTEVEKENLVNGDESMRDTLSEKDLMVTSGTRIDEYGAEGGGEPSSGDLSMFDDEDTSTDDDISMGTPESGDFYVTKGGQGNKQTFYHVLQPDGKIKSIGKRKPNEGTEFARSDIEAKSNVIKAQSIEDVSNDKIEVVNNNSKIEVETKNKNLDLSTNDIGSDLTKSVALTNERIDNQNGGENLDQNTGNLVSANKPNVTEATLKLAAAPLPFVKVIKNNQLSTSPKSYNGLPPEIAAMIS